MGFIAAIGIPLSLLLLPFGLIGELLGIDLVQIVLDSLDPVFEFLSPGLNWLINSFADLMGLFF